MSNTMGSICSRVIFLIYRWMEIIREIRIYKSVSCGISLRISNGISHGIFYGYLTEYLTEYLSSGCGLFSLRNLYVYTYVTGFLYDRVMDIYFLAGNLPFFLSKSFNVFPRHCQNPLTN